MNFRLKNKLSLEDKEFLQRFFVQNPKPSEDQKFLLAQHFSVSIKKIKNWFQNKRAKEREGLIHDKINGESKEYDKVYPQCNSLYISNQF